MKKHILFAVILLGSLFAFAWAKGNSHKYLSLGSGWKQDFSFWGLLDESWTHEKYQNVFVSTQTHNDSRITPLLREDNASAVIAEFKHGRQAAMSLLNINDWEVTDYQAEFGPGQKQLLLTGQYHDVAGVLVNFNELHVWNGVHYKVFTLVYPQQSDFAKKGQSKDVVKRFVATVQEGL